MPYISPVTGVHFIRCLKLLIIYNNREDVCWPWRLAGECTFIVLLKYTMSLK
uniref:Uncharacterized protein n=1 Tax=Anguilla anguilla TaxID=7936 RepID=A0A0E9QJ62_ANGAN